MRESRGIDREGETECWVAVVVLLLPLPVSPRSVAVLLLPLPVLPLPLPVALFLLPFAPPRVDS